MEQIKSNLKAVIGSSKSGVPLNKLEEEYKRVTNSSLNYMKYCSSLEEFLKSVSDVVQVRYFGNVCYLILVTTENDPQCLKKLYDLIQNTRQKKNSKKFNTIPQSLLARSNTFNNLRISVGNDLCTPPRPIGGDRKQQGFNTFSAGTQQVLSNGFSRFPNRPATTTSSANRNDNFARAPHSIAAQTAVANNFKNTKRLSSDCAGNGGTLNINNNSNSNSNSNCNINNNSNCSDAHVANKPFNHNYNSYQSAAATAADTAGSQSADRKSVRIEEAVDRTANQPAANRACIENSQSLNTPNEEGGQSQSRMVATNNHQVATARVPDAFSSQSTPPVKKRGSSQDSFLWPMNTTLELNILHRQVKIHGVQSGYALVTVINAASCKSQYIDVKPMEDTRLPGDIVIWQPPIADPSRPPCTVDAATAFPVVLLKGAVTPNSCIDSSGLSTVRYVREPLVRVRILGQPVMMFVNVATLFVLTGTSSGGTGGQARDTLLTTWRERQTCLCRLAGVPHFLDMWEDPVGGAADNASGPRLLAGTFFAPVSSEARSIDVTGNKNDAFVFERCERRGDFLNCSLLMFGSVVRMPQLPMKKQLFFVELWVEQLLQCKRTIRPNFEAMLTTAFGGEGAHDGPGSGLSLMANESSVFLPIWELGKCENKMLIGCPNLICGKHGQHGGGGGGGERERSATGRLERIVYSRAQHEFQLFDNQLQKVDVAVPGAGASGAAHGWPLYGIYILNERFVHSRLSHASMLRFQAALLLLPDFTKLRN